MALLNLKTISKINKNRFIKHDMVETSYSIIQIKDEKIIQIDTYGSDGRKEKGKISQSIQLDEEGAKWLYELLKKEYHL